ncbi:acyl-CoA thioesterase [Aquibacillus koreensis]|uniref:Acyl-CoA thioesterase n=1 Tax=Aquibacillus koreensis TaxID=279446 RepID=A0A9X3WN69_9BACI|nr:thioesterase family protein [Aquibacillus koreensis]MCT2536383.1 acyl-CoA thioesterase [Aquibacillus koreensis]MDC3421266.1 acyl-CoA thioesterase [Aquibacillus koreensis]
MKKVKTPIKVRYQETDQMGVVYHANYLVWFEIGRTAFIESLGFEYHDMEKSGIVSPVIDAHMYFKQPVRYGQNAFVETWIETYDGLRTEYGYQITDDQGNVAVTGSTKHVIVKKTNFRPVSLRKQFPDWHEAYTQALSEG